MAPSADPAEDRPKGWTLWAGVGVAFLLLLAAWFVMFKVAHSAGVESVPLATEGGRK